MGLFRVWGLGLWGLEFGGFGSVRGVEGLEGELGFHGDYDLGFPVAP